MTTAATRTPPRPRRPTPTPAETRSPAVAEGKARGDLAIGITEQNPNFFWAPGAREGVAPEFVRWQDDMGKLKPSFYRLVLDWPSLQPEQGKPADLAHPYDGCLRGTPPCAGWAGVKDQLAALASRQKQHKGGWQVLVVITGTPDWAARPASGCERSGTQPRSRAPKASAMGAYRKLVTDVAALGEEVGRRAALLERLERAQPPVLHLAPARDLLDVGEVAGRRPLHGAGAQPRRAR